MRYFIIALLLGYCPIVALEYNNGWYYEHDELTYLVYEGTVLGNDVIVTEGANIAKILIWHGSAPDWRNIGDGNPHPNEYIIAKDCHDNF